MKGMKAWVIGASGLLGRAVIAECKKQKISYITSTSQECNIADMEALHRFYKKTRPTHIVNCAAYTDVDKAEKESEVAYAVNATGPENLGVLCRENDLKIVHVSTDYVFDGKSERAYRETDACAPLGTYGMSKWEGEQRLLQEFPRACIVRTSWLFGRDGRNFISSLLGLMQRCEQLRVVGDQRGKPTYVVDLARVLLTLLGYSGIFHFANDGHYTRHEIANDVQREASLRGMLLACREILPVRSEEFFLLAKRPLYSVLDTQKVRKILGITPRHWSAILPEYMTHAF